MAITDSDKFAVTKATRQQEIQVSGVWTDGVTGENKGTYTVSFVNAAELKLFLDQQGFDDVMRAVLLQCLDRTTSNLKPAVFDGLAGKTFQVQQRVVQV